jgi:hypothetical protein
MPGDGKVEMMGMPGTFQLKRPGWSWEQADSVFAGLNGKGVVA